VLRQAYNYAIRREIADRNPAQLSDLPMMPSRDRVLDRDELREIWLGADDTEVLAAAVVAPGTGLAIQLAMLTLQRGGEVVGIHAREIDREAGTWTIPGERTKNRRTHVVPLSDAALEVLRCAFDLTRAPGANDWQGYAFPSPRGGDKSITRHGFSRAMQKLVTRLGVPNAVAHDFRRTGATMITGERFGVSRFVVSRVLNQISDTGGAAAVTSVYDRNEYLVEKRRALNNWARLLEEVVQRCEGHLSIVRLAG
jgi:integrase